MDFVFILLVVAMYVAFLGLYMGMVYSTTTSVRYYGDDVVTRPRTQAILYMLTPIWPVGAVVGLSITLWGGVLVPLGTTYRELWQKAFPRG